MKKIKLSDLIAPSFYNVHQAIKNHDYTHFLLNGGRGSTKSSFIAIEIILGMMKDKDANTVALRKVKDTLKDSVFEQLEWAIEKLGVSQYWDSKSSPATITYLPTGQKILFRGADKPKKIKSTKVKRGYIKFIWFEELDEFAGMEEIRMINQSLMRGGEQFVVFYSYNPPQSMNNWVNTEATLTRKDRLVHHSTYLDVPREWLGEQFILEAEHLKKTKPENYEHEYMGEVTGTGGEVFKNVTIRQITNEEIQSFHNVRRGLDFGYAIDPLSYIVMHYERKKKRLYIYHELYKIGLSNKNAHDYIKEENKGNDMILADSAEPKSIHELRQYGLRIRGVKKGPDSVEYGIKFLQDLEEIIIDDNRCPHTANEFLNYELEKDAHGEFKAKFPDKNNHSIDAVRYGMNDEALQFKDRHKKKSDPDNPTPQEKHQKAIRQITGGKPPTSLTKW